jgi:DMSO/TMAO reductase YedYZ molybdopterin-dependent catalytic subunit
LAISPVAPGKRGFEWVKWGTSIEVNESPKWLQPPLPLQ